MFKYCSLYSGSSGNSFFVQSNTTNLIVDAGVSLKKITTALEEINVNGKNINAILVTHDHIDHTKSLATLSNKFNLKDFNKLICNKLFLNMKSIAQIISIIASALICLTYS